MLDEVDVERLTEILAGEGAPTAATRTSMSHVYCPECGFQNPEAANYCSRCGALLVKGESRSSTTMTFTPEEIADDAGAALRGPRRQGPGARRALRRRPGGGELPARAASGRRSAARPTATSSSTTSPSPASHAVLVRRRRAFTIEDQGSLNGTFVNRQRIESAELENGDELQIGKYRLTFLAR